MKIPSDLVKRNALYHEVIDQCLRTAGDRAKAYSSLRSLYLFGTASASQARFNKIQSSIDLLVSFLYAQETTRFSINLGDEAPETETGRIGIMSKRINELWEDTGADIVVSQAVLWSLIYNSMLLKITYVDKEIRIYTLEPDLFGVYREDVPFLDNQEAVVHVTYVSKPELERRLADHPKLKELMAQTVPSAPPQKEGTAEPVRNIIMASTTPNLQGNVQVDSARLHDYQAVVPDDLVEVKELWVWDDDLEDYRTVTYIGEIVVYDRRNIFLTGELPFVKVSPNPMYNYFWGEAEVQRIRPLQEWREQRLEQLHELFEKQLRPPKSGLGISGITDEKLAALNRAGGILSNTFIGMGGKIEEYKPDMPTDPYGELQYIDSMFDEVMGLNPLMQGKGEKGIRSMGHANVLANLSSARLRKRALIVEDSLEKLATLILRLYQSESKAEMADAKGQKFIAAQFTKDYTVKVSAHTSSPIFAEKLEETAAFMLDHRIIDKRLFVNLIQPPMQSEILEGLKVIEQQEAEMRKAGENPDEPEKKSAGGDKGILKAILDKLNSLVDALTSRSGMR